MANKSTQITDKVAKYLDAREMGMYPAQAARYAGYAEPAREAKRLETTNPVVMEHVKAIEAANKEVLTMTREKVMEGIMEAIGQAKLEADAQGQIRGWAEINRMCGFYEPEKKMVLHGDLSKDQRRKAISEATTEELLEQLGGQMIEDAEYSEVTDDHDETK